MSQPPPVPPQQPGQPVWPPQPAPPRPSGSRRGLVIGIIAAAVVAVLCVAGACVAVVVYYVRVGENGNSSGASGTAPSTSAPAPPQPRSCGVSQVPAGPATKPVGLPDFDGAPRAGTATMRLTTNLGSIVIAMDRAATPCTVASFQHLAGRKFFDGSPCHRLVTEGIFVLQCGDPSGTGSGGPDYQFTDENLGGARYTRGVVAMANAGAGTNGSQFFIVFRDSPMEPTFTPFGRVTAGLDVVDRVAAGGDDGSSPAGGGKPNIGITIQTLTVK